MIHAVFGGSSKHQSSLFIFVVVITPIFLFFFDLVAARAIIAPETPRGEVLRLDGTAFPVAWEGRQLTVRFQDVEGWIDLYLAPPELLTAAGLNARAVLAARETIRDTTPLGRHATLAQSMAAMGVAPELEPILTQSARQPGVMIAHLPQGLRRRLGRLGGGLVVEVQARAVIATVE